MVEVAADLFRDLRSLRVSGEVREVLAFRAHQVDDGGVVHLVVLALERHLGVVDAIGLGRAVDLGRAPGKAEQPWMEILDLSRQRLHRIARGIDGDEQRLHATLQLAKKIEGTSDLGERRWAHVGARGETEKHERVGAAEVGIGHDTPGMIDKREGPAHEGGLRRLPVLVVLRRGARHD